MNRGMMPVLLVLLIILAALAAGADSQQAPAPAPAAGGCSVVLSRAADCLQYLSPGSPMRQPQGKCCTEVNNVVSNPGGVACVCDLLGGHTLGLPLNLTRAAGLPVACGAPPSFLSNCNATSPTPAAPTGGASAKSAATHQSLITAVLLIVASSLLIIPGYHF